MTAPYSATTVANRFIELAAQDHKLLTPMQVIKLVYIAHGWALSLLNHDLVDEPIEAWQYGPVLPSLYKKLKGYGRGGVSGPIRTGFLDRATEIEPVDDSIIQQVYDKYGNLDGIQLSHLTHRNGTPWQSMYRPGTYGVDIPNEVIKRHYDSIRARP